jgi:hypothetical protein
VTEIEESILPHQVLGYLFRQITMVMQLDYGGKMVTQTNSIFLKK